MDEEAKSSLPPLTDTELDQAMSHVNDAVRDVSERISFIIAEGVERGILQFTAMPGHEREHSLCVMVEAQKKELLSLRNQLLDVARERDLMFRVADRLGLRLKYCGQHGFNDAATEIVEVVKVSESLQRRYRPQKGSGPALVQ